MSEHHDTNENETEWKAERAAFMARIGVQAGPYRPQILAIAHSLSLWILARASDRAEALTCHPPSALCFWMRRDLPQAHPAFERLAALARRITGEQA